MLTRTALSAITICIGASVLHADDMDSLLQILDETANIATKTKLNIDYVPSVVSVMRAKELRMLGVSKVADALNLLPGVQIFTNQIGQTTTVLRGYKNPNTDKADKVKILVDGIGVNSEASGSSSYIMDMPIDIIDRIEILRGPGSTVYGTGAFYGAVNIITKSANKPEKNEVFIGGGSWYSKQIGAVYGTIKNGISYSADGYYKDGQKRLVLDDMYADVSHTVGETSFPRPFRTSEASQDFSTGFTLKIDNLTWTTRLKTSWQGNFYGLEERIEPSEDTGQTNQIFTSEISQEKTLSSGILSAKVGLKDYSYRLSAIPRSNYWINVNLVDDGLAGSSGLNDDFKTKTNFAETTYYAEVSHRFNKLPKNDLSAGASIGFTNIRQNEYQSNIEDFVFANKSAIFAYSQSNGGSIADEPVFSADQNRLYLKKGITRTVGSLFVDDIYKLSNATDIIVGARADKYSDTDTQLNMRLGAASRWLKDSSLVTKVVASTGSRVPTLIEKYALTHYNEWAAGASSLKPEQIRSIEIMSIYKPNNANRLSINGYYSELAHVIDVENDYTTAAGYANYAKRLSKGIELEYTYMPNLVHKLNLNASFNKTTYLSTDTFETQSMPDVSPQMYKAWYIYSPMSNFSVGLKHIYQSKTVQNNDYMPKRITSVPANNSTDINLNWQAQAKMDISLTLNNIQNNTIRMPSYYYRNPLLKNGTKFNDGMVREGRNFFIALRKSF